MVKFTIQGHVDTEGLGGIRAVAGNGQTVTHGEIVRFLALGLEQFSRSMGDRLLTEAEVAAMAPPPDPAPLE